jgi:hypothetical protein
MTLGMAWVRTTGRTRELIVASDSRLSGGQAWDAAPKIMLLPRTDCVISFAGDTNDAYPLMLQACNAILMHQPAINRALDISDLKGHLIRVMNHVRAYISNLPRGEEIAPPPEAIFMLAGYSWRMKEFRIWQFHYHHHINEFTFKPINFWRARTGNSPKKIGFVGDKDAIKRASSLLISMLRERRKLDQGGLNMEPLEVLRDIIRSEEFPSVGGPLQVVKLYEHMNAVPFAVYWPSRSNGEVTLLGRALMPYETASFGVIDPDRPTVTPVRLERPRID